jgi:hypothetical protein
MLSKYLAGGVSADIQNGNFCLIKAEVTVKFGLAVKGSEFVLILNFHYYCQENISS